MEQKNYQDDKNVFSQLSVAVNKELNALNEPQRTRIKARVAQALGAGNAQCPICTRIFGVWKLTARNVQGVRVCHICADTNMAGVLEYARKAAVVGAIKHFKPQPQEGDNEQANNQKHID